MPELPHVTAILREAGLVNQEWFTDYARERGSALHKATELHDLGDLDEDSIDPCIHAPFVGYCQFLEEVKPKILTIEEHVEYQGLYQGTLDRRLIINGRQGILDLKGQPSKVDPLQLAGYAMTFNMPMRRWNLYLRIKEGDYKLVEHIDRRKDDADWMAAVRMASFRRDNGLTDD